MFNSKLRVLAPLALLIATFAISSANANVSLAPYGSSSDPRPGAHGDLITGADFSYSSPNTDDLKSVLIDLPYGGVGNPNAVPFADRCPLETFQTSQCPAASVVGEATVDATASVILPVPLNNLAGPISIIQTVTEVPTVVGAYIQPPIGNPIRTIAKYYPVTSGPDGDFRIRTQIDEFPTQATGIPLFGTVDITINRYQQKLNGVLASGVPFITNPTRCETWKSYGYGKAIQANTNANSDPFQTGANDWVRTDAVDTAVDCSTLAPFNTTADATLTGSTRGGSASFTTDMAIPGLGLGDQSPATPKTVVATLPDAVNVDVQQLNRACTNEQFAARACPSTTKFGTVAITTPMIADGLHGDAYLVKRADGANGLPDIGLIVSGAVNFNIRGVNRYTGANFTQIQSTFDNIPAIGFSSFELNIASGANSLLKIDDCPSSGKEPVDGGPTRFTITSYQGQTTTFDSATKYVSPPCLTYTVKLKATGKCVKRGRSFTVTPMLKKPSAVRYVKGSLTKSRTVKDKKRPFKVKFRTSKKLKKGKSYKYTVRVYFKPDAKYSKGRIVKKTGKVKICK